VLFNLDVKRYWSF